jgi:hypothetical protein
MSLETACLPPMSACAPAGAYPAETASRTPDESRWPRFVETASAQVVDGAMCGMMFAIQRRRRLHAGSRAKIERYMEECAPLSREEYFAAPGDFPNVGDGPSLRWASPVHSGFAENDRVHADLYPCAEGWSAPTVFFLHGLMSMSDAGYRRRVADFHARGWNACFIHLPFHYSRKPAGHFNGEMAITADLVQTAEGLRQGVCELRQLMAALRARGCREFGLWASSYGAWIGALLTSVESDFRFAALMEPIVDIGHAIWTSPAGLALRREFRDRKIEPELVERHFHLTSPLHAAPRCAAERVVLVGGEYDRVSPLPELARLRDAWKGSELLRIRQGHFGQRMMPAVWQWLSGSGLLEREGALV